jgi:hypothetical protein
MIELNLGTILLFVLLAYFLIGLGFSIASWLQAGELKVEEGKEIPHFISSALLVFLVGWPFIARYCYLAEVEKSIEKIDFDKLKKEKEK